MNTIKNIYNKVGVSQRGFSKMLKLANVSAVVGFNSKDKLVEHKDVDVFIKDGKIFAIGSNFTEAYIKPDKIVDAKRALITPGFVDPHTHIFPPIDRADEFCRRVNTGYLEISATGGGI